MITTVYRENSEDLNQAALEVLVSSISDTLRTKDNAVLAIPGGRSIKGLWDLLAEKKNYERIDWQKVHVFMADERAVPPTHEDSNYLLAKKSFLDNLLGEGVLPERNVHPLPYDKAKPDMGASDYTAELKKVGGEVDVIILGAGEDGHVGALYPNHHSVKNESVGYIAMNDSPKPPAERTTMSRRLMLSANTALVMFIGEGKREAYEKFNAGDAIVECPARLVKQIGNAYVLTNLMRT